MKKFSPNCTPRIPYEAPSVEVLELKCEGIICQSGKAPNMEHGWDLDF